MLFVWVVVVEFVVGCVLSGVLLVNRCCWLLT